MDPAHHQFNCIEDYFANADSRAMHLQGALAREQKIGLNVAIASIFLLATLAFVLHTAALQVLCPVAVFLMIQYLDRLRKSKLTFQFVSSRLTAETLRVLGAVRDKSALLDLIVSTRSLSTHPVAEESALACEYTTALRRVSMDTAAVDAERGTDFWERWLTEQTAYYNRASGREQARGKKGIRAFNLAFTLVAVIGLGASFWSLSAPFAVGSDAFRALMAVASLIGSCGLAYINFVKDRKAFDQSFDYDHMYQVLSGNINPRVSACEGELFERMVVTETLNEHMRWALRMAGHFKTAPT